MNNIPPEPRKLKRIVIKEELVELLGDFKKAIILNQFIYWSERVKDTDKFLQEEIERKKKHGTITDIELQHGWIYKTAEELSEETMLGLSKASMGRYLNEIVKMGYLERRNNPIYKWDKTMQYRVNLLKVQEELNKIGHVLEGYSPYDAFFKMKLHDFKMKNHNDKNETAIPEITSKITSKNLSNNKYNTQAELNYRKNLLEYNWLEK